MSTDGNPKSSKCRKWGVMLGEAAFRKLTWRDGTRPQTRNSLCLPARQAGV